MYGEIEIVSRNIYIYREKEFFVSFQESTTHSPIKHNKSKLVSTSRPYSCVAPSRCGCLITASHNSPTLVVVAAAPPVSVVAVALRSCWDSPLNSARLAGWQSLAMLCTSSMRTDTSLYINLHTCTYMHRGQNANIVPALQAEAHHIHTVQGVGLWNTFSHTFVTSTQTYVHTYTHTHTTQHKDVEIRCTGATNTSKGSAQQSVISPYNDAKAKR